MLFIRSLSKVHLHSIKKNHSSFSASIQYLFGV